LSGLKKVLGKIQGSGYGYTLQKEIPKTYQRDTHDAGSSASVKGRKTEQATKVTDSEMVHAIIWL